MMHPQQGHPVVMENNPQLRYNRSPSTQPGYWGGRDHLGGYGAPYGDIGGKAAKHFFRVNNPWLYVSGAGAIIAGLLLLQYIRK